MQSPAAPPAAPLAARMREAAARGDTAKLRVLMGENASAVDARDSQGRTPLMLATMNRHRDAVAWLLANGADPNAVDSSGRTPLQVARELGDIAISDELRRAGAREMP
jgi:uncharacterized protein